MRSASHSTSFFLSPAALMMGGPPATGIERRQVSYSDVDTSTDDEFVEVTVHYTIVSSGKEDSSVIRIAR